nr:MAG TPA: hypothetical protein [Caudoviricetes sp.]
MFFCHISFSSLVAMPQLFKSIHTVIDSVWIL